MSGADRHDHSHAGYSPHGPEHSGAPGHFHGPGTYRAAGRRALTIAALLTAGFMVIQVVGGLLTGSLALIADAGHMLSDSLSLFLALGAVILAARPPTPRRTFGYKRAEILAALINGLLLVAVSVWILYEAYGRIGDPHEIAGGGMLAVAVAGLAINVAAAVILHRASGDSLNVSAALRHVVADLLGSVGVIAAAVIILATGWEEADPIVAAVIAALVALSAWAVLRDAVSILLESAPPDLDTEEVGRAMAALAGVVEVHDLHVWTITSGFPALSAHIVVEREADCHERRWELERLLQERFGLDHTTLQVDHVRDELLDINSA